MICKICKCGGHSAIYHYDEIREKMAEIIKDLPSILDEDESILEDLAIDEVMDYYRSVEAAEPPKLAAGKYWN